MNINIWEHDSEIEFGKLRKDNDGHWYLIPTRLLEEFDTILKHELPDYDCHTGQDFDDLYDDAMMKFDKYQLSGGVYDLKVLME